MKREIELVRAIALRADALRGKAEELGQQAARALTGEVGKRQIKGLENLASSTQKISDVFDYIKRQTAKQEAWRNNNFGKTLLDYLENELIPQAQALANQLNASGSERHRIQLVLVREFVRQLSAHYVFERALSGASR
jgi:hypothetical protein